MGITNVREGEIVFFQQTFSNSYPPSLFCYIPPFPPQLSSLAVVSLWLCGDGVRRLAVVGCAIGASRGIPL